MAKLNAVMMDTITKAQFDRAMIGISGKTGAPSPTRTTTFPGTTRSAVGPTRPGGVQSAVDYRALIEPVCRAIAAAHDLWRMQACFRGIVIHGPTARGGVLEGPELEPLLRTQLVSAAGPVGTQPPLAAVAGALGDAWRLFQASVRVPGLPWYPSFAVVPAPQAPPTPNVPTPLAACTFDGGTYARAAVAAGLKRRLSNPAPDVGAFFEAIAEGFQTAVVTWLPAQMVTNVLGKGPVPTFAPPYVPTGPVVGGDNIPTPGHLAA
jgi:hypothetical protein